MAEPTNNAILTFRDALPSELAQLVQQAYLLHLLAVEPTTVLAPGKSLLSMMTQTAAAGGLPRSNKSDLHRKVGDIFKQAFWDEAVESLSSQLPSTQLTRLKHLYVDMHKELCSLLPKNHPVLLSLSLPLPPTSSPLQSCLVFMKEILIALKERCAPVRDPEIDECLQQLESPFINSFDCPSGDENMGSTKSISPVAQRVINVIQAIFHLAEEMKADLDQFVLGNMTEEQLKDIVTSQAKERERETVSTLWGAKRWNDESMASLWGDWEGEALQAHFQDMARAHEASGGAKPRGKWILRLVQALASPISVSCTSPLSVPQTTQEPRNTLPPQFFFVCPALFRIQNVLQALVITATLRSLTRLPLSGDSGDDFTQRVWTLLKAEMDEPDSGPGATKLVNLADEVVRARRMAASATQDQVSGVGRPSIPPLDDQQERSLRAAVERTIQFKDPAFALLQKRLLGSLAKSVLDLVSTLSETQSRSPLHAHDGFAAGSSIFDHVGDHSRSVHGYVPVQMKTGRSRPSSSGDDSHQERAAKRSKRFLADRFSGVGSDVALELTKSTRDLSRIKGYDSRVLADGIEEVFSKLVQCVSWVRYAWDVE